MHRIERPAALAHPARGLLHQACVASSFPATAGELGARVGIARKTAEYHLRYLARLGLVHEQGLADGRRVFSSAAVRAAPRVDPASAALMVAVRARPGASLTELGAALGLARGRIERRAIELLRAGRLESRIESGTRRLFPATA